MKLAILAQITAKPGRAADLEAALRRLIPATRAERGCERYDLHRAHDDPDHFQFHEVWSSEPEWRAHMEAPHLKAFGEISDDLVAEWTLFRLQPLD